ncbi:MAG: hypothetical protein NC418_09775 [Muribaculaceae bacterium]|nr:hypothetical protein [Muribaculaceae bacterium]
MNRLLSILIGCMSALLCAPALRASEAPHDTVYVERGTIVIFADSAAAVVDDELVPIPAPIPQKRHTATTSPATTAPKEKIKVKFAWGADLGASIDMSGNDMSSIDFGLAFGMKRGWINFLGVGAQANIPVSNSFRSYPLFLLFRTNFTDRPTRVFWELKGGVSLNYLEHNHQQTGIYGSTGIGFRLAGNAKFSSHMFMGYSFIQRRKVVGEEMTHDFTDLHFATVKIGVTF